MTYDELENWQSVQYRMEEEGFDYCFEVIVVGTKSKMRSSTD
jgi:hypothetical protein